MRDAFYVGYLRMPKRLRAFVTTVVVVLLLGAGAVALVATTQQPAPGDGTWDLSEKIKVTGTLTTEPYAMLTVPGKPGAPPRQFLLVTMGKVGGAGLDLPATDDAVSITGYPIARGAAGTVLLTVESPEDDVAVSGKPVIARDPVPVALGTATLDGEIVDPKCYFGAMKPGQGKVHKACATLCIQGGIPPMFVTTDADGAPAYYLLVDEQGHGLRGEALHALLPFVADPVRLTGQRERVGDLLRLRIDPRMIERR